MCSTSPTGVAGGAIRELTWPEVDLGACVIRPAGRSQTKRRGVLAYAHNPAVQALIARRLAMRRLDTPLVFHVAGRRHGRLAKRWARACSGPGLLLRATPRRRRLPSDKPRHDFRRTAVRNRPVGCDGADRDGAEGPQDTERLRSLRHRERARSPRRWPASGGVPCPARERADGHPAPVRGRRVVMTWVACQVVFRAEGAGRLLATPRRGGTPGRGRTCDLRIRSPACRETRTQSTP